MTNPSPVGEPTDSPLATKVGGFDPLAGPALDLRWSWNHATDVAWRQPIIRHE
jgi:starch phosphorylase